MLRLPKIKGIIERRILINYRIDLEVMRRYLPPPFEPLAVQGYAIAGICLIRLKDIRPIGIPALFGIRSENGAHRIAVKWKVGATYQEGVYIPRRDTNSRLNALVGGRLFPGEHHLSPFSIKETQQSYEVGFKHEDGTELEIAATESLHFPSDSLFGDIETASAFFEKGSLGYSPNRQNCYDGLELKIAQWQVKPLVVKSVRSTFFENSDDFPTGSVNFDHALLMNNIPHEWNSKASLTRNHLE